VDEIARRKAIAAMKFVRVALKDGYLTDISVAMILTEMERSGLTIERVPNFEPSEFWTRGLRRHS